MATYAQRYQSRGRATGRWRHAVVAVIMACSLAFAFTAGRAYDHYFGVACLNTYVR